MAFPISSSFFIPFKPIGGGGGYGWFCNVRSFFNICWFVHSFIHSFVLLYQDLCVCERRRQVVGVLVCVCCLWPASWIIKLVCMLKHEFYDYSFNILHRNVLTNHFELYLFAVVFFLFFCCCSCLSTLTVFIFLCYLVSFFLSRSSIWRIYMCVCAVAYGI